MLTRCLLLALLVAASATTVACSSSGSGEGAALETKKSVDDTDGEKAGADEKTSATSSTSTTKSTTAESSKPTAAPVAPAINADALKTAGEQLKACLQGCADQQCAENCFADLKANVGGAGLPDLGAGGLPDLGNLGDLGLGNLPDLGNLGDLGLGNLGNVGGGGMPCCANGALFLCGDGAACGDANCQAIEALNAFCGG